MKLLVTGGAGFIGSHLTERLLRDGHCLTVLDDLNDFYSPNLKRANLESIGRAGVFDFHQVDISCAEQTMRIVADARPDAIIHLAARAGVRPSLEQPFLYEQVNVLGTLALLEACRIHGIRKFVFASSSSIYGVANQVPFREDDFHNMPISPYAASKLAAEKFCFTYSYLYGIDIVCLRFFTVFGPRQRPDLAIRKFVEKIQLGQPIPVFGDGTTGRDYTFIADIVEGIRAALAYDTRYEIFNLGNSHPITLNAMIETIETVLGKKAEITRLPEQPGDVPITYADIAKARQAFGYAPQVSFADGIAAFVKWHRQNASA